MTVVILALLVGSLFATGTFLVLRRSSVKLILGLALLSHGINLTLFGTGMLRRAGTPILSKEMIKDGVLGYPDPAQFADPIPQALILTAIVISFAITAFVVVLVKQLNNLEEAAQDARSQSGLPPQNRDPFTAVEYYMTGIDSEPDDYEWLEYSLVQDYKRNHPTENQPDDSQFNEAETPASSHEGMIL